MTSPAPRRRTPILLYHAVAQDAHPLDLRYTLPPAQVEHHLDLLAAGGVRTVTVSDYAERLRRGRPVEDRTVLLTVDDAYADTAEVLLPALAARGMTATVYVTTGYVERRVRGSQMISWSQVAELRAAGIEIGAHSHTHPELDVLPPRRAAEEVARPRRDLEDRLGAAVTSFAYPHGYHTARLKLAVATAGYTSAAAVKNAFSWPGDDLFALARLMLTRDRTTADVAGWIDGHGAPDAWSGDRLLSRGWRLARRVRRLGGRVRPGHTTLDNHEGNGLPAATAGRSEPDRRTS